MVCESWGDSIIIIIIIIIITTNIITNFITNIIINSSSISRGEMGRGDEGEGRWEV